MELHQLRCFVAVVEEGGLNRATTRIHITQPALSYQIKQLENELGVSLLHRQPRGITPTEAGRVLFQHAREVLEAERRALRAVEMLSDGVVGEIRIGTINSVGVYFLPPVLTLIQEKYPLARSTIIYGRSLEVMEALLANQVDLAIVADPRPNRRFSSETITEETVSLVCSKNHPFCDKSSIVPSDLWGQKFVSLSHDTRTGHLVRDHLIRLGVNVDTVVSTPNVDTAKKMVETGLGIAFLPDMTTKEDILRGGSTLHGLVRLDVRPPLTRSISLVTLKKLQRSQTLQAFIDEVRQHGANEKACVEPPGPR
ncbi:MAG: LysR family transcriptional regulator [Pseudomonadota bacterium]